MKNLAHILLPNLAAFIEADQPSRRKVENIKALDSITYGGAQRAKYEVKFNDGSVEVYHTRVEVRLC